MKGFVDDSWRALLDIFVTATLNEEKRRLTVWVDTAFNGGLVVPREQVERLKLRQASTTQAVLADGRTVDLETYTCHLDWFGKAYRTQVVANDGEFPLLGTQLLVGRKLTVDYRLKTVEVD